MKTEYSTLLDYAGKLESIANSVKAELDGLKDDYSKVGADGTVWGGIAAEKAKSELDKFSSQFDGFYGTIIATSKNLRTVVANYESADAQAIKM